MEAGHETDADLGRADARRNRVAVLEAAASLLADQPDASMRAIADASGVGRTTVYRHFPTRTELLEGLWEHALERGVARSRAIVEGEPPLAEVLAELGREVLESGDYFRFLQSHRNLRVRAWDATQTNTETPLVDYLHRAHARGELRADVPVSWVVSLSFSATLAMADQVKAGLIPPGEAARLVTATLVSSFVA